MLTKLNIPKKINVGFQTRPDTYTNKLAVVVYTDAKGVLRKEKSWNGWRDKKIDSQEFDNTPVSGFVLNKKVGGYRSGWNSRGIYVRIYDPRDFEFEISVANLLFILEETSSIKGKGLEGEFVYSWDGTELVLLPVNSQEYQASSNFTELQTKKVTAKEMAEGCLYLNKDNEQVMYLGRHDWYEIASDYITMGNRKYLKQTKQHIFVSVDGKSKYWTQTGFTKLGSKLSQEPSPLFAEEFEKFKNSIHGSEPVELVEQPLTTFSQKVYFLCYQKKNNAYYPIQISSDYRGKFFLTKYFDPIRFTHEYDLITPRNNNYTQDLNITKEEIEQMPLFTLAIKNKRGILIHL